MNIQQNPFRKLVSAAVYNTHHIGISKKKERDFRQERG